MCYLHMPQNNHIGDVPQPMKKYSAEVNPSIHCHLLRGPKYASVRESIRCSQALHLKP